MAALRWQLEDAVDWLTVSRTQMGDYRLIFGGSIEFEISADGSRIDKPSAIGVSQETVDTLYFNQVLPLALSRQGALVLLRRDPERTGLGALRGARHALGLLCADDRLAALGMGAGVGVTAQYSYPVVWCVRMATFAHSIGCCR